MTDDTDLMNLHHIASHLGKTVDELGDLPVPHYFRWVAYLKNRERMSRG